MVLYNLAFFLKDCGNYRTIFPLTFAGDDRNPPGDTLDSDAFGVEPSRRLQEFFSEFPEGRYVASFLYFAAGWERDGKKPGNHLADGMDYTIYK